ELVASAVRAHVDIVAGAQHRLELLASPPTQLVATYVRRDQLAARRPQLVPVHYVLGLRRRVDAYRLVHHERHTIARAGPAPTHAPFVLRVEIGRRHAHRDQQLTAGPEVASPGGERGVGVLV